MRKACSDDEKSKMNERQAVRIASTCNLVSRPLPNCSEMREVLGWLPSISKSAVSRYHWSNRCFTCVPAMHTNSTAAQYIQSAAFRHAFCRKSCTNHVRVVLLTTRRAGLLVVKLNVCPSGVHLTASFSPREER